MHPTNTDLITRWLTWKEHNEGRQPGTVNKYFRYLEGLAAWLQQEHEMGLLDADRAQLEAFCGLVAHKRGAASWQPSAYGGGGEGASMPGL